MTGIVLGDNRNFHWLRPNEKERSPHRFIVMDSESHMTPVAGGTELTFRLAVARRWHDERGKVAAMETGVFDTPESLWEWVGEFTRKGRTTVLWCHNLDHDMQQTKAFWVLPLLGWTLEWSNLDEQVSMAKWTRDGCTLKMADTHSWIPKPLKEIGQALGIGKPELPAEDDSHQAWVTRCVADVDITACLVDTIVTYVREQHLGNFQYSGAGQGYSMWRHKFLEHKVLVHADEAALEAERAAMHTGRAEARQWGTFEGGRWTEWDIANAYTRIARDCELPRQLIHHDPGPPLGRVLTWMRKWRVLVKCRVTTDADVVPVRWEGRELWPVGEFTTYLWDCELEIALEAGARIQPLECWCYFRAPIMSAWATETIQQIHGERPETPQVMRWWWKHQARATIGRCGMRYTQWEEAGDDWLGITGISHATRDGGATTFRLLHIGGQVWEETGKVEGRDSMPMIPSWIAAQCRVWLWQAMRWIGDEHLLYVDTDSVIVDRAGSAMMAHWAAEHPEQGWRIKGEYRSLEIHGPRQLVTDAEVRIAGVSKRARRTGPADFTGEVWMRASSALAEGTEGRSLVKDRQWHIQWADNRRTHAANGRTEAVRLEMPPEAAPESSADERAFAVSEAGAVDPLLYL